jgi:hypothetical protein
MIPALRPAFKSDTHKHLIYTCQESKIKLFMIWLVETELEWKKHQRR